MQCTIAYSKSLLVLEARNVPLRITLFFTASSRRPTQHLIGKASVIGSATAQQVLQIPVHPGNTMFLPVCIFHCLNP